MLKNDLINSTGTAIISTNFDNNPVTTAIIADTIAIITIKNIIIIIPNIINTSFSCSNKRHVNYAKRKGSLFLSLLFLKDF